MTFFCENGHIVLDVPHHYIVDEDPTQCPICKSKNIKHEFEWGDPDYCGSNIVPAEPVRVEKKRRVVHIPVYDVSKLFRPRCGPSGSCPHVGSCFGDNPKRKGDRK